MPAQTTDNTRPPAGQGSGPATASGAPPGRSSAPGLTLSVVVPAQTVQVTSSVTVEIAAASAAGVVHAPLHLVYDPTQLRFLEASEGDFMNRDGGATVFLVNGHSRPGDVVIGIGRFDRSRGALGRGTLCRARFEVLAPGTVRISIGPAMAWAIDGSLVPVTTNAAEFQVLP
jgi:hypothetical protein